MIFFFFFKVLVMPFTLESPNVCESYDLPQRNDKMSHTIEGLIKLVMQIESEEDSAFGAGLV